MTEIRPRVSYMQMKEAVGSLAYLWSGIERALSASIRRMTRDRGSTPVHGISRSIDAWAGLVLPRGEDRPLQAQICERLVALLKEALVVRNLVFHGLRDIRLDRHDREAHLEVELGEDRRRIAMSELESMFRWMGNAPGLIADLTAAALETKAAHSTERLAGWEDFPLQR
jgi:hypothetical protein